MLYFYGRENKKRGISAFFAKFWGISAILLKVLGAFQQISFEKRGIFAYSPYGSISVIILADWSKML